MKPEGRRFIPNLGRGDELWGKEKGKDWVKETVGKQTDVTVLRTRI